MDDIAEENQKETDRYDAYDVLRDLVAVASEFTSPFDERAPLRMVHIRGRQVYGTNGHMLFIGELPATVLPDEVEEVRMEPPIQETIKTLPLTLMPMVLEQAVRVDPKVSMPNYEKVMPEEEAEYAILVDPRYWAEIGKAFSRFHAPVLIEFFGPDKPIRFTSSPRLVDGEPPPLKHVAILMGVRADGHGVAVGKIQKDIP